MRTRKEGEEWDMEVTHGDTWPMWNFDIMVDAVPVSPGYTVLMQIKRVLDGGVIKEFTEISGFVLSGNNVRFNANVDILPGRYIHDIQITLANGEVYTQYAGTVNVIPDVSY